MNKRIAYLLTPITAGGASKSFVLMMKALKDNDFYKKVYYPEVRDERILNDINNYVNNSEQINIKTVNCNQAYQTKLKIAKKTIDTDYSWFVEKLKEDTIDILHINTSIYPHIVKLIKENTEIKVITHVREIANPECKWLYNYFVEQISKSDHIIFISENEQKPFLDNMINSTILFNPFDFNEIKDIPENDYYKKAKGKIYVGMMGAFTKMKGQVLFLKIAKELLKKSKEYHFVLIGYPTKNKNIFRRLAKVLLFKPDYIDVFDFYFRIFNLKKHFTIISSMPNVFPVLQDLDIYVRPSLGMDPWGRDIIENMAMGNTVFATGSVSPFINNGVSGYLVSSVDEDVISNSIFESSICNYSVITEFIKRKCDMKDYSGRINATYKNVLLRDN